MWVGVVASMKSLEYLGFVLREADLIVGHVMLVHLNNSSIHIKNVPRPIEPSTFRDVYHG